MNPNLNSNSSNNFSGGNINGYGNTITNNVDQSRKTKIAIGFVTLVIILLLVGFGIHKAIGGGNSTLDKQRVGTWSCVDHSAQRQTYVFKSNHKVTITYGDDEPVTISWKINESNNLVFYEGDYSQALIWNSNLAYSMIDERSWAISGDVLYMYGLRFDKQ